LISGRAIIFLLVTLTLSAGILTISLSRAIGRRARGSNAVQRRSAFVPWWDRAVVAAAFVRSSPVRAPPRFWTYAPAALTAAGLAALAYVAATLFGVTTSALRMAFGGHFFTDVRRRRAG